MTALVRTRLFHAAADVMRPTAKWWLRRDGDMAPTFVDLGPTRSAHQPIDIEIALAPAKYVLGAGEAQERGRIRKTIVVPAGFEPSTCDHPECSKKVPFQPGAPRADTTRCAEHRRKHHPQALPLDQPTPPRRRRP